MDGETFMLPKKSIDAIGNGEESLRGDTLHDIVREIYTILAAISYRILPAIYYTILHATYYTILHATSYTVLMAISSALLLAIYYTILPTISHIISYMVCLARSYPFF